MSWLSPSDHDRALLDETRERAADVALLAMHTAPALRIEPLLLRNQRLRVLPDSDASLEQRLWFSRLVASRSVDAAVIRPGVARLLCDELIADGAQWGRSSEFVKQHTRHWPAQDRDEQALRWAVLLGDDASVQRCLQAALARLAHAPDDANRVEQARWAKGALPALFTASRAPAQASWLTVFAAASLGDASGALARQLGATEGELPAFLRDALPSDAGFALGLRLRPGVLECVAAGEGEHTIRLPTAPPSPVLVRALVHPLAPDPPELSESDSNASTPDDDLLTPPPTWHPLQPGYRVPLPADRRVVILQALTGERWQIAARETATPQPQEAPGAVTSAEPRRVLIVFAPGDDEYAYEIAELLRKHDVDAQPAPESPSSAAQQESANEHLVVRLWSERAARLAQDAPPGSMSGVVVRLDDAPLAGRAGEAVTLDFRGRSGGSLVKQAEKLAGVIRERLSTPTRYVLVSVEDPSSEEDEQSRIRLVDALAGLGYPARMLEEIVFDRLTKGSSREEALSAALADAGALCVLPGGEGDRLSDEQVSALDIARERGFAVIPVVRPGRGALPEALLQHKVLVLATEDEVSAWGDLDASLQSAGLRPVPALLLAVLDDLGTPPERRLEIGDRLAEIGDPRPGVGLRADGLPDIEWREVSGGEFIWQDGERRELPGFWMSRYAVTNAQYQAFIDAGGYGEPGWWEGLGKRVTSPEPPRWSEPNRARTNVSWHEAVAFCRWLTSVLGYQVRLPVEQEWEKSARGPEGRVYPWGEEYVSGDANVNERRTKAGPHYLMQTTAVGMFPQGASEYGIEDLSGNVWEWCLNGYEKPRDGAGEVVLGGDVWRALRGGSWDDPPALARAVLRRSVLPVDRDSDIGFRVLCASPIPGL